MIASRTSLIPKARQIDTTVIADARKGTTRVVARSFTSFRMTI